MDSTIIALFLLAASLGLGVGLQFLFGKLLAVRTRAGNARWHNPPVGELAHEVLFFLCLLLFIIQLISGNWTEGVKYLWDEHRTLTLITIIGGTLAEWLPTIERKISGWVNTLLFWLGALCIYFFVLNYL